MHVAVLAEVVNRQDVGMIERRSRLRFPMQPFLKSGTAGEVAGQDLQRHLTAQTFVAGEINFSHSTRAQQANDLIGAHLRSGAEGGLVPIERLDEMRQLYLLK